MYESIRKNEVRWHRRVIETLLLSYRDDRAGVFVYIKIKKER